MEQEKLGIEHVKSVLKFMIGLVNAMGKTYENGKPDMADLLYFAKPMLSVVTVITAAKYLVPELSDLDPVERQELCDFVASELVLPQKNIEQTLENLLGAASRIFSLYDIVHS